MSRFNSVPSEAPLDHIPFDEASYLRLNPDVSEAVRNGYVKSGLQHFVNLGVDELETKPHRVFRVKIGASEYDFDSAAYCADNPDVAVAIKEGRYRSGIDHFLHVGYRQCCEGTRLIYSNNRFVSCLALEPGEAVLSNDRRCLVLFAHYDRHGIIGDHIVTYVKALRAAGADICFITATNTKAELNKISDHVFSIVIKNDAGRDFGSWYIALRSLHEGFRAQYERVMLVNDSVYFPVADSAQFLAWIAASKLDLCGLTDSRQHGVYHLQSYFLAFGRTAQAALLPWLLTTYESIPYFTKSGQIASFELGLSQRALDVGLTVGAFCSIDKIVADLSTRPELTRWRSVLKVGIHDLNPSHHIWDLLVEHYSCPALKVELLRDNPLRLPLRRWKAIIDPICFDRLLVSEHLTRAKNAEGPR